MKNQIQNNIDHKSLNLIEIEVTESYSGQRIDKVLVEVEELKSIISTRSFAQNMIEKKFITVNSKFVKPSYELKINDLIQVFIPEKSSQTLIPYNFKLNIIFEDSDLIVIDKPSGLVVHPAAGHEQDTLVNALLFHTQELSMKNELRPGIVHRIDKETSGLLVVAKNDFTHEHLSQQFKMKTIERIYYALVEGRPKNKSGRIESFLARHPTDRKRYASIKHSNINIKLEKNFDEKTIGKFAVTHYEVIQSSQSISLIKLKLETGRTHQIRVHMQELGHPLVGDHTYGYSQKKSKELKISRFYLHAAKLGFIHPKLNQELVFNSNWPDADLKIIKSWGFEC